jgi:hypothetical protein
MNTATVHSAAESTAAESTGATHTEGAGFASRLRGWRAPIVIVAIVLLGGAIIAWLQSSGQSTAYLSPGNTGPDGGHALAAILADRGEQVITANTASAAAEDASGAATGAATGAASGAATILVTNPYLLSSADLAMIGQARADVVLTDPDPAALAALAPGVTVAGQAKVSVLNPGCGLAAAMLAGNADAGGTLLSIPAAAVQRCYFTSGYPSLLRYTATGRQITVLGTGAPFTNTDLGTVGNAALALNLLGGQPRVIWLSPAASPAGPPTSGQASFTSLIPKPVYMVTIQLLIAVVLLALWRMRRLGPVLTERLPVVVRASETTEGHGRLYHARRSRDQAAAVLRAAAISRMLPRIGLPPDAGPDAVAAAVASRAGQPVAEVGAALSGPAPAADGALVALADRLDELERKVGAR